MTSAALIDPDVQLALNNAPGGFTGKLNIYVCRTCRGHMVTRDVDKGTTPFMVGCRVTPGCAGNMQSSMYQVFDQEMAESHQWFRPASADGLTLAELAHVRQGGLLLREAVL